MLSTKFLNDGSTNTNKQGCQKIELSTSDFIFIYLKVLISND